MTQFKVGDKVRVLESAAMYSVLDSLPYETRVLAEDRAGWFIVAGSNPSAGIRRSSVPGRSWCVSPENLELIEEPAPAFTPYEGWEEDVRLLAFVDCSREGTAAGDAAKRLLAAFPAPKSPNCGKALQHDYGEGASSMVTLQLPTSFVFLTCTLPANHDGPHVPDVPDEAWR